MFLPGEGGDLSKQIMRLCEGSMVPERPINPGPVYLLRIHFECLVRCVRFLILFNACCSVHIGSKGNYLFQLNVHFLMFLESFFIVRSTCFGPH
jgi:hypothetical protein